MIDKNQVIQLHTILIEKFGGGSGIRNEELLESAIQRPFQTFDENELYPSPISKAAAVIESLLINHPFIDGNKRIGYTVMRLILIQGKLDLIATEDEKYNMVISVAEGKMKFDEIVQWLESHTTTIP